MKKLAVIFPGIGYTCQKPLLYYLIKWLKSMSYNVMELDYTALGKEGLRGNTELIKKAVQEGVDIFKRNHGMEAVNNADQVILIGKSIGSAVASYLYNDFSVDNKKKTQLILLTPLEETLEGVLPESCLVIHGNRDPWAKTERIQRLCKRKGANLQIIDKGNHSLETGNIEQDMQNHFQIVHRIIAQLKR